MGKFTNSLLCKIYGKEWTILQICNFLLLFQFIYCRWKIVSLWKIYAHTILLWNAQKTIAYCCRYRKQKKKVSCKKNKRKTIQRKWTRSRRRMTLWCQRGQEEIMIVFGWRRMEEIIIFFCFTNSYEKSRFKNKLNRTSNLALWPQKLDWKKKVQECVWLGSHD